jgi:thiosulfate/3-mercaptopyruvate sulfurtransferase
MRRHRAGTSVAAVALLAWAGHTVAAPRYKGFERGEALITVEELKKLIDAKDPKLVVLAVVDPLSYRAGHIPGSINVWRPDYDLEAGQPYPFEGMLQEREGFQDFARRVGVDNDSKVVVYDEKYDAVRVWWAFHLYGKTDVRVLDGGYAAWKSAGHPGTSSLFRGGAERKGDFVAKPRRPGWVAQMADVRRAQTAKDVQLWDSREVAEWSGAEKKGNARRAGRIPWAAFQSWKEYRLEVDGKPAGFKPAADIQRLIDTFKMDRGKEQIFYCHSGVRSATPVFVLYLMGWDVDRLHNYDGSWLEWSYYEQNPVATGP